MQTKDILLSGVPIFISVLALFSSIWIGKRQVEISQIQTDFQNKVELYLFIGLYQIQGTVIPAIYIKNAGNGVIYLTKYHLNGEKVDLKKLVLPSMSICNEAYHYIPLPNVPQHLSFQVNFKDWQNRKWKTEGDVEFVDGNWRISYSPCERRKDD